MYTRCEALEKAIFDTNEISEPQKQADAFKNEVFSRMTELRIAADEAETLTDRKFWPYPDYADLLFGVR